MNPRWATRAKALGILTILAVALTVLATMNAAPGMTPMIAISLLGIIATVTSLVVAAILGSREGQS